jgi:hypothetical protein
MSGAQDPIGEAVLAARAALTSVEPADPNTATARLNLQGARAALAAYERHARTVAYESARQAQVVADRAARKSPAAPVAQSAQLKRSGKSA